MQLRRLASAIITTAVSAFVTLQPCFAVDLVVLDSAPFIAKYDALIAVQDPDDMRTATLVIVPKQLEFELNTGTGKPRFGVQYAFSGGLAVAQLTASLRFSVVGSEMQTIVDYAERWLGVTSGSLASTTAGLKTKILFAIADVTNSKVDETLLSSNTPIDGPFALSVNLATYGKARLLTVLSGQQPLGGALIQVQYPAPVFIGQSAREKWLSTIAKYRLKDIIFSEEIFSKSPSDVATFRVRAKLASKLGAPISVEVPTGLTKGWMVAAPSTQAVLTEVEQQAPAGIVMIPLSPQYESQSWFFFNTACIDLKAQIIDLNGDVGCDGLAR
jgi:hypothetical protein